MFFSLFSHRMPNSISVTYLISPFFIENVKDIRLFQIERMLTQAISVCRWSWKEDWAEFLIHHSTLAGSYYYSIKLLSLWTRVQSLMIFLLYIGTLHWSLSVQILLSCQGWIKSCLLARTVADRNSTMTDSFIHFLIWHTEIWVADSNGTSGMSLLTIEQNLDKISLYLFHVQLNQAICNAKKSRKSNRQYLKTSRQF